MEEEIDIIELLKRVKEGKAPKRILINDNIYKLYDDDIQFMYRKIDNWNVEKGWFHEEITLDTKIKILPDNPIIEEIKMQQVPIGNGAYLTKTVDDMDIAKISIKINEIIRHINKGGKINE